MESEWVQVRLGDLISIKHGFAFKGEFFVEEPTPFQLTTPGNFAIGGGFQIGKPKYYNGPVPSDYVLSPGDLIVTMTDLSKAADTLGFSAIVPTTPETTWLHNQRVGLVQTNAKALLAPQFLNYLMRTSDYRHWVVSSASGSTVKHTSPGRICDYSFSLPPLAVQQEIANILGGLDDKIALLRETNATLEAVAQSIFKSWFVDFDPVRAKAEGREPEGMPSEVADLFPSEFEDSELGVIPKGWRIDSLDSIANFLNGLAMQKFPVVEGEEFIPVIKIAQLRKGDTGGADRASMMVPSDYVIKDGDVLFSWSGSLEVAIWCGGTGALNQHLFKVTSGLFPKWFYYLWTKHHLPVFRETAANKATTMGHIQRHHLTEAKVVVPPQALLNAISTIIEPLIERAVSGALEIRSFGLVRDTLLPRLMSGKLRIPEVEEALA